MKKTIIILVVLALVVLGAAYMMGRTKTPVVPGEGIAVGEPSPQTPSTGVTGTDTKTPTPTTTSGYTLADVAKHAVATDCWTAINGNVYNLTSWVSQHPGGPEAIISICGKDGSAAFNGKHGQQMSAQTQLARFKVGALAS
jgi:predicted heme/steroid binding protein